MAEEKDIALLADNDIIVEIEVQEAPTVVIESPHTTTAEISGDSALGIIVGTLPTLAKEKTLTDGISSIEGKLDNLNVDVDLTSIAKEETLTQGIADITKAVTNIDLSALAQEATLTQGIQAVKDAIDAIPSTDLTSVAQESTLLRESEAIKQAIAQGGGGGITLANDEEYAAFKTDIQIKINDILNEGL